MVSAIVVHVAGPLTADGVQRCLRCDEVLSDYRNAMIPEDDPHPVGWRIGAHVEVTSGWPVHYAITMAAPTCRGRDPVRGRA